MVTRDTSTSTAPAADSASVTDLSSSSSTRNNSLMHVARLESAVSAASTSRFSSVDTRKGAELLMTINPRHSEPVPVASSSPANKSNGSQPSQAVKEASLAGHLGLASVPAVNEIDQKITELFANPSAARAFLTKPIEAKNIIAQKFPGLEEKLKQNMPFSEQSGKFSVNTDSQLFKAIAEEVQSGVKQSDSPLYKKLDALQTSMIGARLGGSAGIETKAYELIRAAIEHGAGSREFNNVAKKLDRLQDSSRAQSDLKELQILVQSNVARSGSVPVYTASVNSAAQLHDQRKDREPVPVAAVAYSGGVPVYTATVTPAVQVKEPGPVQTVASNGPPVSPAPSLASAPSPAPTPPVNPVPAVPSIPFEAPLGVRSPVTPHDFIKLTERGPGERVALRTVGKPTAEEQHLQRMMSTDPEVVNAQVKEKFKDRGSKLSDEVMNELIVAARKDLIETSKVSKPDAIVLEYAVVKQIDNRLKALERPVLPEPASAPGWRNFDLPEQLRPSPAVIDTKQENLFGPIPDIKPEKILAPLTREVKAEFNKMEPAAKIDTEAALIAQFDGRGIKSSTGLLETVSITPAPLKAAALLSAEFGAENAKIMLDLARKVNPTSFEFHSPGLPKYSEGFANEVDRVVSAYSKERPFFPESVAIAALLVNDYQKAADPSGKPQDLGGLLIKDAERFRVAMKEYLDAEALRKQAEAQALEKAQAMELARQKEAAMLADPTAARASLKQLAPEAINEAAVIKAFDFANLKSLVGLKEAVADLPRPLKAAAILSAEYGSSAASEILARAGSISGDILDFNKAGIPKVTAKVGSEIDRAWLSEAGREKFARGAVGYSFLLLNNVEKVPSPLNPEPQDIVDLLINNSEKFRLNNLKRQTPFELGKVR